MLNGALPEKSSHTQVRLTSALLVLATAAPLFLSDFRISLLGKFLALAILAVGIDWIWGYTGILSLGHGVFFGLGAYCTAMVLKLEASGGQLPDFMVWSGLEKLPWFWEPFANPVFAFSASLVLPMAVALFLGAFTFRNRIKGVFFTILSQAVAVVFVTLFIGQQAYTGGTNGITSLTTVFGFSLSSPSVQLFLYYLSLALLLAVCLASRRLLSTRTGKILVAIRDGENRARFSGYNPAAYQLFVYTLSEGLAGLSGILYVMQEGIISTDMMGIVPSVEMVLWVAVGGRGTLIGAVTGAVLVNEAKTLFSESFPDLWLYFLGSLLILTVLFMPRGIVGLLRDWADRRMRKRRAAKRNEHHTLHPEHQRGI